jgi:hypothetical protein
MNEPLLFEFRSGINPEHAEGLIAALGEPQIPRRKVVLKFDGYPYVNTGVGWRIGNALRRYSGDMLEVRVPSFQDGKGDWFRCFTRSCLGDAFAAHAGVITSPESDITTTVKNYYTEKIVRKSQNAMVTGAIHEGVNVDPEREDLFRDTLLQSLRLVNVRPAHFDRERLQDVIKLTFEAIQNVYDHAARKPLPDETKILSYVLLGYYKTIGKGHPDPAGRLKAYLSRLPLVSRRKREDFIEICVNDDGAGIAARQSQDLSIYWGPKDAEERAVREELTARSSVKLRAHDARIRGTPGQGYTYIDSSLKELRAFAVLRTGRLLAVFDGTDEANEGFVLLPGDLGYMPGTTLDVLIPILKDGDGQPSLFPDE